MRNPVLVATLLIAVVPAVMPAQAQHEHRTGNAPDTESPYVDLVDRQITTLSNDDVSELLSGSGWGFALPAELNGLPGPRHVLDMADDIGLTDVQRDRTQEIFDAMQAHAISLGELFVERERTLDAYFEGVVSGDHPADRKRMAVLVDSAGAARSRLRSVHLAAHLSMMDVLTSEQIEAYLRLRGYARKGTVNDPCANVPEGHDPRMWRRHNECDG